jgi:hypothetical protein
MRGREHKAPVGVEAGDFGTDLADLSRAQALGSPHHRGFQRGIVQMRERIAALGQIAIFQRPAKRARRFDVECGNRFDVACADDGCEIAGHIPAAVRRQRIDR